MPTYTTTQRTTHTVTIDTDTIKWSAYARKTQMDLDQYFEEEFYSDVMNTAIYIHESEEQNEMRLDFGYYVAPDVQVQQVVTMPNGDFDGDVLVGTVTVNVVSDREIVS